MSSEGGDLARALVALDEITRRLRAECPWDREQDERTIVPHTVEEAYELAEAAHSRDDAKLLDELGDVLFQVYFLSLLLEERGQGSLAAVADHCRRKLIRRHPHVFGDVEAEDAETVRRNWDEIKRTEEGRGAAGLFSDVPENLPSTLYARKLLRRASSGGAYDEPDRAALAASVRAACRRVEEAPAPGQAAGREERFEAVGELLLAAVALAREEGVDPELALRRAADAFRKRTERTEVKP
ncbi:MAG: MazG family protein [Thermoleophilaceae bacterium]|nr:MazG family protein [Thermoleophilaceae bacterium]